MLQWYRIWLMADRLNQGGDDGAESDEEALSDYVVVERSDVLEAIGQFVAAYLATMPEAQHLQPKQLQAALTQTFKVLHPDHAPCITQFCESGKILWARLGRLAGSGSWRTQYVY